MNAHTPVVDFELRVEQYRKLRAKQEEIEERHKEELAPYKKAKADLEALMLGWLNATGQENAKTKAGTVYKKTDFSASLEDPDAFMRYVIGSEAWDLIDRKANKTAIKDFLEEHKTLPPGVKVATVVKVGVTAPTKPKG